MKPLDTLCSELKLKAAHMLQHDHHECAAQHRLRLHTLLLCLKCFCLWLSNARAEENVLGSNINNNDMNHKTCRQGREIRHDHYY